MAYAIQVMVIERKTGKGLSGQRVKLYGGSEITTNSSGIANLVANASSIVVYVNGFQVYSGSASGAPRPIIYNKG